VVVTEATQAAVAAARAAGRSCWRVSSTLFAHIASDVVLQPLPEFVQAQQQQQQQQRTWNTAAAPVPCMTTCHTYTARHPYQPSLLLPAAAAAAVTSAAHQQSVTRRLLSVTRAAAKPVLLLLLLLQRGHLTGVLLLLLVCLRLVVQIWC
jgi:hypothetical protein